LREYESPPIVPVELNFTTRIMVEYQAFLPKFCVNDDDHQYGSTADRDVTTLQAISQRIHYGARIMEVKYNKRKKLFDRLVRTKDFDAIRANITDDERETRVLKSVLKRATTFGLDKPHEIVAFYRDSIIPMTKDVQIEYLFRREHAIRTAN
jgi:chorismate mutase